MAKASFTSKEFANVLIAIRSKKTYKLSNGSTLDFSASSLVFNELTVDGVPISADEAEKLIKAINDNSNITELLFIDTKTNAAAINIIAQNLVKNNRISSAKLPTISLLDEMAIKSDRAEVEKKIVQVSKEIEEILKVAKKEHHSPEDMNRVKGTTSIDELNEADLIEEHNRVINENNRSLKILAEMDSFGFKIMDAIRGLFRTDDENKKNEADKAKLKKEHEAAVSLNSYKEQYIALLIVKKSNNEILQSFDKNERDFQKNIRNFEDHISENKEKAIKELREAAKSNMSTNTSSRSEASNSQAQKETIKKEPIPVVKKAEVPPPTVAKADLESSAKKIASSNVPSTGTAPLAFSPAVTAANNLAGNDATTKPKAAIKPVQNIQNNNQATKVPILPATSQKALVASAAELTRDIKLDQYHSDMQERKAKRKSTNLSDLEKELKEVENERRQHVSLLERNNRILEDKRIKLSMEITSHNNSLTELRTIQREIAEVAGQISKLRTELPSIAITGTRKEKQTKINEQLNALDIKLKDLEKIKSNYKSENELTSIISRKKSEWDELNAVIIDRQQDADFSSSLAPLNIQAVDSQKEINSYNRINHLEVEIAKLKNLITFKREEDEQRELDARSRGPATELHEPQQGISAFLANQFQRAAESFSDVAASEMTESMHSNQNPKLIHSFGQAKPSLQRVKVELSKGNYAQNNEEPSPFDFLEPPDEPDTGEGGSKPRQGS